MNIKQNNSATFGACCHLPVSPPHPARSTRAGRQHGEPDTRHKSSPGTPGLHSTPSHQGDKTRPTTGSAWPYSKATQRRPRLCFIYLYFNVLYTFTERWNRGCGTPKMTGWLPGAVRVSLCWSGGIGSRLVATTGLSKLAPVSSLGGGRTSAPMSSGSGVSGVLPVLGVLSGWGMFCLPWPQAYMALSNGRKSGSPLSASSPRFRSVPRVLHPRSTIG